MILKRARLAYSLIRPFSTGKIHQDIIDNYKPLNGETNRMKLILDAAFGAFRNPERGDLVSELGDLTSFHVLINIREKMMKDPVGRQILEEKPRVSPENVNVEWLSKLGDNTFGKKYFDFMNGHHFKAEERPLVKYIPDYELAYILQRYREIHDFIHALLAYDIDVDYEIAVKWFEMIQLGLPSTTLSAFVGPLMLKSDKMKRLADQLPTIIQNARNCPFVMNIYWEKEFETDISVLRKRLRVQPLKA